MKTPLCNVNDCVRMHCSTYRQCMYYIKQYLSMQLYNYMHVGVIVDDVAQQIKDRRIIYTHIDISLTYPKIPTGRGVLSWLIQILYFPGGQISIMDSKMLVYQSLIVLMCDITKSACTIAILTKKNSSYSMASHKACLE